MSTVGLREEGEEAATGDSAAGLHRPDKRRGTDRRSFQSERFQPPSPIDVQPCADRLIDTSPKLIEHQRRQWRAPTEQGTLSVELVSSDPTKEGTEPATHHDAEADADAGAGSFRSAADRMNGSSAKGEKAFSGDDDLHAKVEKAGPQNSGSLREAEERPLPTVAMPPRLLAVPRYQELDSKSKAAEERVTSPDHDDRLSRRSREGGNLTQRGRAIGMSRPGSVRVEGLGGSHNLCSASSILMEVKRSYAHASRQSDYRPSYSVRRPCGSPSRSPSPAPVVPRLAKFSSSSSRAFSPSSRVPVLESSGRHSHNAPVALSTPSKAMARIRSTLSPSRRAPSPLPSPQASPNLEGRLWIHSPAPTRLKSPQCNIRSPPRASPPLMRSAPRLPPSCSCTSLPQGSATASASSGLSWGPHVLSRESLASRFAVRGMPHEDLDLAGRVRDQPPMVSRLMDRLVRQSSVLDRSPSRSPERGIVRSCSRQASVNAPVSNSDAANSMVITTASLLATRESSRGASQRSSMSRTQTSNAAAKKLAGSQAQQVFNAMRRSNEATHVPVGIKASASSHCLPGTVRVPSHTPHTPHAPASTLPVRQLSVVQQPTSSAVSIEAKSWAPTSSAVLSPKRNEASASQVGYPSSSTSAAIGSPTMAMAFSGGKAPPTGNAWYRPLR